jgi:hypothetical protein
MDALFGTSRRSAATFPIRRLGAHRFLPWRALARAQPADKKGWLRRHDMTAMDAGKVSAEEPAEKANTPILVGSAASWYA